MKIYSFSFKVLIIITAFYALLNHTNATAAYLKDRPTMVKNPDGTEIHCYSSGDEYFNYLHDEQGYTIIQGSDGFYYYAITEGDNVIPSIHRVNEVNPKDVGLQPYALISSEEYQKRVKEFWRWVDNPRGRAPHTGTLNNLVVYIRFSDDTDFNTPREEFDALFNPVEGISLKNFFNEASYGLLNIESHHYPVVTGQSFNYSFQDSHPRAYYQPYHAVTNPNGYQGGDNGWERTDREQTLLLNAINAIAGDVPVDLNIDADNDGLVDNVCFIIRGGSGGWAELLWAHRWVLFSVNAYINGKLVYDYTFQPETQTEVSTLTHEMFHTLGAPDLYQYYNDGNPVGPWDLMAGGFVHMGAYMKMKYTNNTWISEIPTISGSGTYTLHPITSSENNAYRINSPNSNSEFFIVEYRKKEGLYENNLPGSGLLVYRINPEAGDGNADGPPDEVYIYRPNGTLNDNGNIYYAHFSANVGRTSINDFTNPSSFLSNGAPGGLNIKNIGAVGETISFQVVNSYNISVGANPTEGGSVSISPDAEHYEYGTTVTLEANPNNGYIFEKWTANGDSISNANPLQFSVPDYDVTIVGHFKWVGLYNITLIAYPEYAGVVNDDTNQGPYMPNSLVSISATANPGYEFKKWTIADDSISAANPLQYTVQAADDEIVGHFGWITNTPTTSIAGVTVFPNPFSNTLSINNASSVESITISNLIGQEVFKQTPANNVNFTINTHGFQRGIYLVTLEMLSGERIVKRIVKN